MVRLFYAVPLLLLTACAVPLPDPAAQSPAPRTEASTASDRPTTAAMPEAAPPGEPVPAPAADNTAKAKTRRAPSTPAVSSSAPPPPPVPSDLDSRPIEEVVVKPGDVTGYWRLIASHTIDVDIGIFSGIHIRYGGEVRDRNICWLQQTGTSLTATCASGNTLKSGSGSVSDDGVTMHWWIGAANIIFSGKFTEAEKISGGFSGGVIGMSVTGDVPATLVKLNSAEAPERPSAALLRMVWEDVRRGERTAGRYDGAAAKRIEQGLPKELAAQPVGQLTYLGEILIRWRKEQRETLQDVYQVRTPTGRKLCRIAANEQGQVLDLNCLDMP